MRQIGPKSGSCWAPVLALALASAALALAATPAGASYKVIRTWGEPGIGEGQLEAPLGVSLDGRGSLWVGSDRRIIRIAADEGGDIWALEVGPTNNVARVGVYAPAGSYIGPLNLKNLGVMNAIASDHHGGIYASRRYLPGDTSNVRGFIESYTRAGSFLGTWGTDLVDPRGIAFGPNGRTYVLDDDGIHVYANRVLTGVWGGTFAGRKLGSPFGIAADQNGFIYVADRLDHRVLKINSVGHVVAVLTAERAKSTDLPFAPGGIDVARTGEVFVGDTNGARIVEFAPVGPQTKILIGVPKVTSFVEFQYEGTSSTGDTSETLTFECRLDADPWTDCTNPYGEDHGRPFYFIRFTDVRDGPHTFDVRAVGADGNTDATPAHAEFTLSK